jgi:selenophosphate synthetase-related protein
MTPKLFEIRDRATFIPVLAIDISAKDGYLARRAGFGHRCIQLVDFEGRRTAYNPYDWSGRTFPAAHAYIETHWDELADGDVVDVEFVLGETTQPKVSEERG